MSSAVDTVGSSANRGLLGEPPKSAYHRYFRPYETLDAAQRIARCQTMIPLDLPDKYKIPGKLPPFLHVLPPELRNKIYELLDEDKQKKRAQLSMVREDAVGQVLEPFPGLRAEYHSYYFSDYQFVVDVFSNYTVFGKNNANVQISKRCRSYGKGKIVLNRHHWMRQPSAGVRFWSIAFRIMEPSEFLVADIFLNARPYRTKSRAKMIVRGLSSANSKQSFSIMSKKARGVVSRLNRDQNFAGFTIQDLDHIAKCFEWNDEDVERNKEDNSSEAKRAKAKRVFPSGLAAKTKAVKAPQT